MKVTLSLITFSILLLTSSIAASAPIEVWLTPARAAELQRVTSRPRITRETRVDADTSVYHWTNGARSWDTTQRVQRVIGKPAHDARREQFEAERAERKAIMDELQAVKAKPTKQALDAIISKHSKK